MRLIDADGLKHRILAFCTACNSTFLAVDDIVMAIDHTDTVDSVPVVRCKECIYYEAGKAYFEYCRNSCGIAYPDGNDFCSYGEYKSNLPAPANREYLSADVRKKDGGNV